MGRNDIRLKRQRLSSGRIAQHRNYGELMAIHERDKKIKRIIRVFIYFLIVAVLLAFFFIMRRWELKKSEGVKKEVSIHFDKNFNELDFSFRAASFTPQATSLRPEA